VKAYARTLATVKPKLISEAVEEFLAVRKPKARAVDGKRSQLSPVYAMHVETGCGNSPRRFRGITLAT
jgi:hypothetical protein